MNRSLLPLLALLLVGAPGCIFIIEADAPYIYTVDAWCDGTGWWLLEADVGHDSGPRGVRFVDVEVTELWYDPWGEVATFLGTVELAPEGDGWWSAAVRSSPSFLDCSWPDDYELRFIAEDTDGDLDVVTIIR